MAAKFYRVLLTTERLSVQIICDKNYRARVINNLKSVDVIKWLGGEYECLGKEAQQNKKDKGCNYSLHY